MYSEDDLLMISALQHLAFCERQWGLIHLENIWADNVLTVKGSQMHERTHEPSTGRQDSLIIAHAIHLRSLRLGIVGKADSVEFHLLEDSSVQEPDGFRETISISQIPFPPGQWIPFPVEYKHGKPKLDHCDDVQLCAQALCLEEMLNISVPSGAIFYGKPRRRTQVTFDDRLRDETERLAERLHKLTDIGKTPLGNYSKRCKSCSLFTYCLPKTAGSGRSARKYLSRFLWETEKTDKINEKNA